MKNHRSTKSGRPKPVAGRSMVQWESAWCHHKVPQLLQFVHHTAGPFALTLFSADLKTVFVVWRTCLQHRVNQRQQFASQSNRCTFSALPLFYPPVPTGEVQASFSGEIPSHLAEHTLQIRITFVNVSTLAFSGTLVVTGTQTGPGAYMLESGKALISVQISTIMAAAAVTSMPGMEHRRLNASSCFVISFVIRALHSMAVLFKRFQVPKYHAKKAALVLRERTVQGNQYFVDTFPGLRFQAPVQSFPRNISVFHEMTDDVSPGSAKCVRQKRCEAETGALQKFIDAILLGGNVANDALTIPGQMPQFPEGLIWDKTSL